MKWLFFPIIVVVVGYYFYEPAPEKGWKEPWKTSMHLSFLNVFNLPSKIVGLFSGDTIAFNR